jgi:uncharacterized protein (TIGR03086 family)
MTDISPRYLRAVNEFNRRVAAVPLDQWDAATPCEGWTARDVVGHVVSIYQRAIRRVGETEPPEVMLDHPRAAWETMRDAYLAMLATPGTLERSIPTPVGTMSLAELVDSFAMGDLVVHSWDLAHATGGTNGFPMISWPE